MPVNMRKEYASLADDHQRESHSVGFKNNPLNTLRNLF